MFRRFLTVLALLALSTSLVNGFTYASTFNPSATSLKTTKEKKKCAPCSAALENDAATDPLDKLATLGRRTQVQPFMLVQRSIFDGAVVNFVSTAFGQLAFAVTDLELTGVMPLMFQRIYSSDRNEDTGLGAGWSLVMDDRITLVKDKATMKTGNGAVISFQREAGGSFRLQADAPFPHQSFDLVNEETIREQVAGLTRTYVKVGDAYRLSRIADQNGNTIAISFDARGNMARIESSSGGTLTLDWSNGVQSRLLSVADNTGRRVAFKQDGNRLRAATDPAGAQWTYDYDSTRLTRAADPLGRILLRARYDRSGRAVEAGDAAGAYLYDYDSTSAAAVSRLTTVTDPMGAKTDFEHSENGTLTAITDSEGRSARLEYNAANRLVRVSNSLGDEAKFTYDAQNRPLRQWSTDGTDKSYSYDERGRINSVTEGGIRTDYTLDDNGQIITAQSSDSMSSYRASYNARGQLASLKSANREVSFEYDGRGNKTAFTYSDVGRFGLERDAAGRVTTERFPSGLNIYDEYDARGWLSKQSDSRGRSTSVERDASGAPVAFVSGNGKRMSAVRDAAGRVIATTDSDGSTQRFAYDARGALTDYTDTHGRRFKYEYDRPGRLRSIIKEDGTRTKIERDERGRVLRLTTAIESATQFTSLAHALLQQTSDGVDILSIDVWAPNWTDYPVNGGLLGGGGVYLPMETTGNDGGGGGETCEQCISRQHRAANDELVACLLRLAIPGGVTAALGCAALVAAGIVTSIGAPAAAYICGAVVSVAIAIGCIYEAAAKYERARDNCPSCK